MSLIIKEEKPDYPLAPDGLQDAVLVDVVDLGELDTPWGPKHKLSLVFELEDTDPEGKHYVVTKRYTWSLNEKSNLRKDLERWRCSKFTTEDLEQGIDMEAIIGLNATLFISHNESEEHGKTFANIETILPRKKNNKVVFYDLKPSGDYTRVVERENYKEPEEYAEMVNS
ncbi:MAG: hypothetical protein ABJR05_14550 [Balneola sp.]